MMLPSFRLLLALPLPMVIIHLPGWLRFGLWQPATVLFVFVFGFLLVIIVYYTQSLWSAIIAHSLNDFLAGFLFRL